MNNLPWVNQCAGNRGQLLCDIAGRPLFILYDVICHYTDAIYTAIKRVEQSQWNYEWGAANTTLLWELGSSLAIMIFLEYILENLELDTMGLLPDT